MKKILLLSLLTGGVALFAAETPSPASAASPAPTTAPVVCPKAEKSAECPKKVCPKTEKSAACPLPAKTADENATECNSNLKNMGRGVVNIGTCFLELPRNILYKNAQVPFWGFIAGAVNGTGCTAMRAFAGLTDLISFGFEPGTAYNAKFRPYVWQSQWLPTKKK